MEYENTQKYMDRVLEETLDTMDDVIQYLCPFKKKIRKQFGINSTFIFRGVSDHNYQLKPSLYRESTENNNTGKVLEEFNLLKSFVDACDLSGTQIPADSQKLRNDMDIQKNIKKMIAEQSNWLIDGTLNEVIGLAQHYGVPTRFLDWSYQPLVALYFASIGAIKKMNNDINKDYSDSYIAVWAYLAHDHPKIKIVNPPKSINSHISYQQGCFTFMIQDIDKTNPFDKESNNDPVKMLFMDTFLREDTSNEPLKKKRLIKIKIPYSLVIDIYKYCDAYSFNATTLFRGPHGSAEYTNEKRMMHKVKYLLDQKKRGLKPI